MLVLETSIQQLLNVVLPNTRINDLIAALPELGRTLALAVGVDLVDRLQNELWLRLRRGEAELVCTRCGVVHRGKSGLVRRGNRARKLKTSTGVLQFRTKSRVTVQTKSPDPYMLFKKASIVSIEISGRRARNAGVQTLMPR